MERTSGISFRLRQAIKNFTNRLWKDEEGQDLIEYGLLITLIALAVTSAMKPLATAISKVFNSASSSLS
jgi:pilus assembly protein Flp/PilA